MREADIAVLATGMVSPVGLTAEASCAAIRSKLTNPVTTGYVDRRHEWIVAYEVPMQPPLQGIEKLVRMAAMAVEEALAHSGKQEWADLPLLLCTAETDRPGRMSGLDAQLASQLQASLGVRFSTHSTAFPQGRVAVALALAKARELVVQQRVPKVLVLAADTHVWPDSLEHYARADRLLTERNSNGFIPGEGAVALLVGRAPDRAGMFCEGLGFADESAFLNSGKPLRSDGLASAVNAALSEGGCGMRDVQFRIADLSGEQYFFKEAALALARTLHQPVAEMDLWHPAECIGEAGSVAGATAIAYAFAAFRKGYAPGARALAHFSSDGPRRAAVVLGWREK